MKGLVIAVRPNSTKFGMRCVSPGRGFSGTWGWKKWTARLAYTHKKVLYDPIPHCK